MIVLGVDPGPEFCGAAIFDTLGLSGRGPCVNAARNAWPVEDVIRYIGRHAESIGLVAIERVQSYGIAGGSLLRTSEVVGRLWQAAASADLSVTLLYRREVLTGLDVTGKGNRDSLVRARLIEMHGGTRQAAQGTKRAPGPLYGVSGHAWQALAVAIVGHQMMGRQDQ